MIADRGEILLSDFETNIKNATSSEIDWRRIAGAEKHGFAVIKLVMSSLMALRSWHQLLTNSEKTAQARFSIFKAP